MTNSTKAERVHLHLLEELRESVRTVKRERAPAYRKGAPSKANTRRHHQRIMFLKSKGKSRKDIHEDTGLSYTTIDKHLKGRIKTTKR